MSDPDVPTPDRRLLLLTSTTRDAAAVAKVLVSAGIEGIRCKSMHELCQEIAVGAAAVLLPEEVLIADGATELTRVLANQPVWSDLPVILLSSSGAEVPMLSEALGQLGNVTVVERPVRVSTLVSVVRTAIRGRDRQYQLRDHVRTQARTQAMLVESADHYRNAADLNPQFPWTADPQGNALEFSHRWMELTGQSRKETLGSGWIEASHGDDREAVRAAWKHAVATAEPLDIEYRLRLASGNHRWVRARAAARRNGDGQVLRWYGTIEDVHARRVAEEAVRDNAERLRLAVEAARLGGWEWEPTDNRIVLSNRAAEILGIAPDERMTRERFRNMVRSEDLEALVKAYTEAVQERTDFDVEHCARRADGNIVWFAAKGRGEYDSAGQFVRMVGVLQDITARKQQELQRQQLLDAERAARADAENANRLKDEFLSIVSHELRTPLNAILGWSQILRSQPDDPEEVAEGLEVIERNAKSQTQLIEDLLDMSRIIGGKVRLDVQRVNLPTVIDSAIASMQPAAEARGVHLLNSSKETACHVNGDADRLQQVVWNLVSNAIKFTPRGGHVTVDLHGRGDQCEIIVKDTGLGMKKEFLPYVFDRFRQAEGSTTRRHGGLGLGLSIVKQLVELHGGTVRVESRGENQGATFRVSLPMATDQVVPQSTAPNEPLPERAHVQEPADPSVSLAGVKVLVVDDEPDARALARRLLEDAGATVETAGSVDEALEQLNDHEFDVMVSDIGMPTRDGYELVQALRALDSAQGTETAAVALTAFARGEDRTRALNAGFNEHLVKPVNFGELLRVVARLAGVGGAV